MATRARTTPTVGPGPTIGPGPTATPDVDGITVDVVVLVAHNGRYEGERYTLPLSQAMAFIERGFLDPVDVYGLDLPGPSPAGTRP